MFGGEVKRRDPFTFIGQSHADCRGVSSLSVSAPACFALGGEAFESRRRRSGRFACKGILAEFFVARLSDLVSEKLFSCQPFVKVDFSVKVDFVATVECLTG